MPEGPEVTVIAEQLSKIWSGYNLSNINILTKKNYAINNVMMKIKAGIKLPIKLIDVGKKGKYIYFWFSGDIIIGSSLGLSGHYSLNKLDNSLIEFVFSNKSLYYNDVRHFGIFQLLTLKLLNEKLDKIGPDILTSSIRPHETKYLERDVSSADKFVAKAKKYQLKQIVQILVDQKIISGIGNYLKSEILYKAKIYPGKIIKQLSAVTLIHIYETAKMISNNSLQLGGVSIRDYKDVYGKLGKYQPIIYGKKKVNDKDVIKKTFKDP